MAAHELILKHKSAITYFESGLKKLYVLESSNIKEISNNAQAKIQKINVFLEEVYVRVSQLQKILENFQKNQQRFEDSVRLDKEKIQLEQMLVDVENFLGKHEYAKALGLVKKIVYEHQNYKPALKLLSRAQKLYDKNKRLAEQEQKQKEKVDKTLADLGVDADSMGDKKKKIWFVEKFQEYLRQKKLAKLEKTEYLKRQHVLQSIEKILLRSGSIDRVGDIDVNEDEMFSILSSGLTKDVWDFKNYGFDFYGKIMGKDKIIWDTFWYYKADNSRTIFYFWDATGHGVQAGFTVAVLSKLFFEHSKKIKNFQDLFMTINNDLKERIKWKSFITAVFFEWDSKKNILSYIGAGHNPLILYKHDTGTTEKVVPGWLALWVRYINNTSSIKPKEVSFNHQDILLWYTDGIIEARNWEQKMYSMANLENSFKKICSSFMNPQRIFESIMKEVTDFQEGKPFDDDASLFVFVRNSDKDLISDEQELKDLLADADMKKFSVEVNFKNKTKQEITDEIKRQKHDKDLKVRLDRLDRLYRIWEYIKLKQDIVYYYREGFVHEKMKYYLEKAIANEYQTVIKKREEKLQRKYLTLADLYKKWEYETVIREALDVIFKNGKI